MKRTVAIILSLIMILSIMPIAAYAETTYDFDLNAGDEVTFGKYEQDNDFSNGAEDIEWIILECKGNRILLVSKYLIDVSPYNEDESDATWAKSDLRKYLNETFYRKAFDADERKLICEVEVNTPDGRSGTDGGSNTMDKVFVLSIEQLTKYFSSEFKRKAIPTEYAKEEGAEYDKDGYGWYWARNPGKTQNTAAGVHVGGGINYDGRNVSSVEALRPALWVDIGYNGSTTDSEAAGEMNNEENIYDCEIELVVGNRYNIGDEIKFGEYEQDNDESNGKEELEWIVLDKDEYGRLLLLTKYVINALQYGANEENSEWSTSTIRSYASKSMQSMFYEQAKQRIREIEIDDGNGNVTYDQLFILSKDEVEKYFPTEESRKVKAVDNDFLKEILPSDKDGNVS